MKALGRLRPRARRAILAAGIVAAALWLGWRGLRLAVGSPVTELRGARFTEGTRVLARDGRPLGERPSAAGLSGRRTRLSEVSPRLVAATLTSEDRAFYTHDGVDRAALARALGTDLARRRLVSGGSTITAQLVKRLEHEGRPRPRTLPAKVREMARAQNLEADATKDEILEAYLDLLDYGNGLAGPEAAALGYFGVSARDLSLAQAALLAVLPRAPSALDPRRHLPRAVLRQRALLAAMRARGAASPEDVERALSEPIVLAPRTKRPLVAPHVVLAAAQKAKGDVHTTLDLDLQRDLEAIARTHAPRLRERAATGIAIVVLDPASGDVLAEVGGAEYFDARAGAVDLARSRRQAGSTLKPFLYARAFERGVSPMAMLADVPTELGTTGAVYAPDNFDGTFVGPVSAREALAGSLNVPAVRLARDLGVAEVVATLRRAGLAIDGGAERHGLALALGSAEVSPRELAGAYATLARGGERVTLRDRIADPAASPTRAFEAAPVALVDDALSDPLARVRGLHARGPFELGFPVAIKTGTSTGFRDAWTAGYTRERVVVVWVGNASGAPTDRLTGASAAGPVFFDAMRRAMAGLARAPLHPPELVEEAEVCALSGERPGDACPDRVTRTFARGHAPGEACAVHRRARPLPPAPGGPSFACDPGGAAVVIALPDAFSRFLAERSPGAPGVDPRGTPVLLASRAPGCAPERAGDARVVLLRPRSGTTVRIGDGPAGTDVVEVVAETRGMPAGAPLEVVLDGAVVARTREGAPALVPIGRGDHDIEVRPADPAASALLARAVIRGR